MCSAYLGSEGVINIEREAALSGAIHTKGFYILGGLLPPYGPATEKSIRMQVKK